MKKIFLILSVMLLAASCHQQVSQNSTPPIQSPTPTPTPTPSPTQTTPTTYTSPDKYGFSITYSSEFGFNTDITQVQGLSYIPVCDQNMVACIFLLEDPYKGTNFDGAGVSVNVDPTLTTQAKCYNFSAATNEAQTVVPDVIINGVTFKSATGGGGAAGHFDKLQVYRNFHNNMCYELTQDVVETNIDNYDPGTIKAFDEHGVWQKLQDVVTSFTFTR